MKLKLKIWKLISYYSHVHQVTYSTACRMLGIKFINEKTNVPYKYLTGLYGHLILEIGQDRRFLKLAEIFTPVRS